MSGLHIVTITTEIVVFAEDAAHAEKFVKDEFYHIKSDMEEHGCDIQVSPFTYMPYGYDGSNMPYGDTDKHIGDFPPPRGMRPTKATNSGFSIDTPPVSGES